MQDECTSLSALLPFGDVTLKLAKRPGIRLETVNLATKPDASSEDAGRISNIRAAVDNGVARSCQSPERLGERHFIDSA
jgi:hypothetical protein